jgi:putative hydrolase of the HAD superfamily
VNTLDLIAFDADDTLWHNEILYRTAQARFIDLLSGYHSREWIENRLYETEMRNLQPFGYGIKAFVLSMIETAVQLTEGRITGRAVQQIIEFGKEMLNARLQLLEGVEETLATLSGMGELIVITKGDLLDQEMKIASSGLRPYFSHIEIVSQKTALVYRSILERRGVDPARFMMVGNSLKSDILPVLEIGGMAVYIPHALTWAYEQAVAGEIPSGRFYELAHIGLLPELVEKVNHYD